MADELYSFMQQ